jgi:hypothetical protein
MSWMESARYVRHLSTNVVPLSLGCLFQSLLKSTRVMLRYRLLSLPSTITTQAYGPEFQMGCCWVLFSPVDVSVEMVQGLFGSDAPGSEELLPLDRIDHICHCSSSNTFTSSYRHSLQIQMHLIADRGNHADHAATFPVPPITSSQRSIAPSSHTELIHRKDMTTLFTVFQRYIPLDIKRP